MAKVENLMIDGKTIFDIIYPIGSIYYTTDKDFDPNTEFGGTWSRIKGKMIVGVDEDDDELSDSQTTGGEKLHTLTENELPVHRHNMSAWLNGDTNYGGGEFVIDTWRYAGQYNSNGQWMPRVQTSYPTGGGAIAQQYASILYSIYLGAYRIIHTLLNKEVYCNV